MNRETKFWIEKTLMKLPFVNWDRFVKGVNVDYVFIGVFGWIDRDKDCYKDFVHLEFALREKNVYFIACSSARHSERIAEILDSPHNDCVRVESKFKIPNVVKLKRKK